MARGGRLGDSFARAESGRVTKHATPVTRGREMGNNDDNETKSGGRRYERVGEGVK